MNERDWLIIRTLYKNKNITKTAKELFISQPSLTARIQNIEKHFDAKLIHRGTGGVQFTAEGEFVAHKASEILETLRGVKEQVAQMSSDNKGVLRIAGANYIIKNKLPYLLGLFKEKYPNVEFEVRTAWSREVINLLHTKEIHVGFVRSDYGWSGCKTVLQEERLCVAFKKPFELKDLPKLSRIDYQTDYIYRLFLDSWWADNYKEPPKISIHVNYMDICRDMVQHGVGYAIVPETLLYGLDNIHKVFVKDKEDKEIYRPTIMLYEEEMNNIKLVKLFVEFAQSLDYSVDKICKSAKTSDLLLKK